MAIGLFAGLVPGPLQMLTALLLAVPLRKNLPVALLTTLYTNPFTIVPLYVLAYGYGSLLLGLNHAAPKIQPFEMDWGNLLDSMVRSSIGHWHSASRSSSGSSRSGSRSPSSATGRCSCSGAATWCSPGAVVEQSRK